MTTSCTAEIIGTPVTFEAAARPMRGDATRTMVEVRANGRLIGKAYENGEAWNAVDNDQHGTWHWCMADAVEYVIWYWTQP